MTTKITTTPTPLAVVDKINEIIDDKLDKTGTVAIANGGTGATTAANARTNLGLNDAIVGLSVSGKVITYTQADGGEGTITTQDTNTTYSNMTAATASAAGKAGLVPAPAAGAQSKFLRGDGTWQNSTGYHTGNATSIGGASATTPAVVVKSYRNGATWYRVWSDGWVEQGGNGKAIGSTDSGKVISLPYTMADKNYTITIANTQGSHHYEYDDEWVDTKTTTSFKFYRWGDYTFDWIVTGKGV